MQRIFGRNRPHEQIAPYRGVPVVNLLPRSTPFYARMLAAEGDVQRRWIRVALVLAVLMGAFLLQNFYRANDANVNALTTADLRLAQLVRAQDQVLELEVELDAARESSSVPALDHAYLTRPPLALLDAFSAVFQNQVPGVTVVLVEAAGREQLTVQLAVTNPLAALEWRNRMSDYGAIERVINLDLASDNEVAIYDAALRIAGAGQ